MIEASGSSRGAIAAVLLVGALLRLTALDAVPPPLNQDEASRGYDAWALWQTGADRHGQRRPLFLESFGPGDYTGALSTYLTIPFVAILGPTTTAMRLPDALLGIATIALLYGWLKRSHGRWPALAAAAILALDPWHIALCRTAHEAGYVPFLLTAALWALYRAGLLPNNEQTVCGPRSSAPTAFVAGALFGLLMWVYPAARLFTPLLLIAWLVIFLRCFKNGLVRRWLLAAGALGLAAGTMPLLITLASHPEFLAARARATVLFFRPDSPAQMLLSFAQNYLRAFDPLYWFVRCDEMSGATIPHVGLHLLVFAPLAAVGIVRVIRHVRHERFARLVTAWLLLFPVPAAICADWNPHPLRLAAGIPLFPILCAEGSIVLAALIRGMQPSARSLVGGIALAAGLINVGWFADSYFRRFPSRAEPAYQTALLKAISFAAHEAGPGEFILVTNRANQPFIYVLLAEPISPNPLVASPPVVSPGPRGFDQVLRVGRYFFVPLDPVEWPEAGKTFDREWSGVTPGSQGLVVERLGRFDGGGQIAVFHSGDGARREEDYEVRRWRKGT